MLKILKYLKKHFITVLFIIGLLIIQANCDLALPGYTSDIVDIGIQQGGVEEYVPKIIRQSAYEKLKLFIKDESILEKSYTQIDSNELSDKKKEEYEKKYPGIKNETLLELNDLDKEDLETLEEALQMPIMMVQFLSSDDEKVTQMKEGMLSAMGAEGMDATQIDIFDIMAKMPKEQRLKMMEDSEKEQEALPEMIINKMESSYVISEYNAIGMDMGVVQNNYLFLSGAKMLGLSLLGMLISILVCLLASRVAASVGKELRGNIFKKVIDFSNTEMERFSTASLITRSTNDIQQVQLVVVLLLRMVCYAPILGLGGLLKVLSNNDASMGWIILVAVAAVLCIVVVLFFVAMPKFKKMQTLVDRVNLVAREILTGLPVIRAFTTEKHEENRFDEANTSLTKTMLFTNRVMTFMMPLMMLLMNVVSIMIIWYGAKGINDGTMDVGQMMAFITYTMMIIMSFLMLTMMSIMLPRAMVSAKRVDEVLTTEVTILDPKDPKAGLHEKKGVVEFKNVFFHYPGAEEAALEDITFTAEPGKTTAFIGSTGSGKSTLVNLIPRFYDVTKGSILVEGIDVREMSKEELCNKLGYVPQKGVLFSGTIESNMKYGKEDLTEEEMKKTAQIAQAEDFIEAKPEKYQSEISQGGSNVSGGQKQRLSIARAIAKRPQVYIFDDSFSALDYKTDVVLRKALKEETENSTVLIVAQRISTILHADQIIVLDDGKIAGMGTHKELLATCEAYQQIAYSQLSKEELEGGMA